MCFRRLRGCIEFCLCYVFQPIILMLDAFADCRGQSVMNDPALLELHKRLSYKQRIEKTCRFTSCYVVLWVTPTLWDLLLVERLCCASLQMKCCQLFTMNIINSSTWSHNTGSLIIILSLTISASTLPFLYEQHLGNGRVIYSHYALLIQGCVYYAVVLLSFYHIFYDKL